MRRLTAAVFVLAILTVGAIGSFEAFELTQKQGASGCPSNYTGHPVESQVFQSKFSAVTEYSLPSPQRSPNAIAVAPDGSVWFGEESLPALAHLQPNGTLLEYLWPGPYPPSGTLDYSCSHRTQIWGVALWDGLVWASDSAGNQLVGLDPNTGAFRHVTMPSPGAFPYTLTVGPDDSLWFTEASGQAIGRLDRSGNLHEFPVPTGLKGTPEQIYFVNSTYALYADAGEAGESNAGIFAFNPADPVFTRVGANRLLNSVTSLAVSGSGIWVSEHGPSYVEYYDRASGNWSNYPTSIDSYSRGTFIYFLLSDGSLVWFNEHYGDRIAEIDPAKASMVEYSVSDPPASNISTISNVYTIARDGMKVWFTQLSAGRVGFADFSVPQPFVIRAATSDHVVLRPGTNVTIAMSLQGNSVSPLSLLFSDSESQNGRTNLITAFSRLPRGLGPGGIGSFDVTLSASATAMAGNYIFDVTISDGFIRSTQFLFVSVQ